MSAQYRPVPHRPAALLAAVLALLAIAPAPAQDLKWRGEVARPAAPTAAPPPRGTPQGSGDYLSRMDSDRDGKVSVVEYQDWLSYAFDGMDRNGDGVLSAEEQPGGRGAAMTRPITRDTHRARLAERFRRQDIDRSGFLDAKELAAPPQGR
jgi:hypothetical protein